MLARFIEFAFIAYIVFLFLQRIVAPFRSGYKAREQERNAFRQQNTRTQSPPQSRIDRSRLRDAEFKDVE